MEHALESQFPVVTESPSASALEDMEGLTGAHRARILRFVAFSIHDLDAAEAITQECFLKAWRSRAQFRGDCAVGTWLTRIAYRLICDHTRSERFKFWKAARTVDAGEIASALPAGGASPEKQAIARQQVASIMAMLEELPHKQRTVFSLRFLEEMSVEEIASTLDMPSSTVKTHIYRATAKIRKLIGERP
jgi:RNA polymerase sigma-70 factor (ECF subfamily)